MFFTPFLGLFDSLHHGRMASLSVKEGNMTFDYSVNGTAISFKRAWSQFKIEDPSHFFSMPLVVGLSLLSSIFFFRILASAHVYKLAKASSNDEGASHTKKFKCIIYGLHSFLTPPLHPDWDELFNDRNGKLTIKCCWTRFVMHFLVISIN